MTVTVNDQTWSIIFCDTSGVTHKRVALTTAIAGKGLDAFKRVSAAAGASSCQWHCGSNSLRHIDHSVSGSVPPAVEVRQPSEIASDSKQTTYAMLQKLFSI